jgi:RNA polymerase sigma factor (sigma-70 family)
MPDVSLAQGGYRAHVVPDPDTDLSPEELLPAVCRGEAWAWPALVGRYERLVRAVAARHRLAPDEVSDVVQTTWLRLIQHVEDIRDPRALPAWLGTTAAREAVAVRRRSRREVTVADVDTAETSDVEEQLAVLWSGQLLRRAMADLSPRERRLIEILLLPDELSYREIGRRLGMPVGSIGPVRQRAFRRLRRTLAAYGVSGVRQGVPVRACARAS